jgi:hypothetical protein
MAEEARRFRGSRIGCPFLSVAARTSNPRLSALVDRHSVATPLSRRGKLSVHVARRTTEGTEPAEEE